MPTYEYRCPNGHLTEKFAKISESTSQIPCAVCGAVAERQISGGAGLVFKGSGFYLTDYGKSGSAAEKARSESRSEKSESKGDGKSDAKSDTKSETKSSDSKSESSTKAESSTSTKKDSATKPATKSTPKTE